MFLKAQIWEIWGMLLQRWEANQLTRGTKQQTKIWIDMRTALETSRDTERSSTCLCTLTKTNIFSISWVLMTRNNREEERISGNL